MYKEKMRNIREALWALLRPAHRTYVFAALIVLLVGCLASFWAARSVSTIADRNLDVLFAKEVSRNQEAIAEQLNRYTDILRGGVGLFKASDNVSRQEWREFAINYGVGTKFPGLQAIGVVRVVPASDKAAFEEQVRAEGYPNFSIFPAEPVRDPYTVIYYIEPTDTANSKAFGYDMASDPTRRQAMERARDTGQASITNQVRLIQNTARDVSPGILIYMPIYTNGSNPTSAQERQQNLVGYVYAPIRIKALLDGINQLGNVTTMGFQVYDGQATNQSNLLYESKAFRAISQQSGAHRLQQELDVNGHKWTSLYLASESLNALPNSQEPLTVLVTGIILSLLLSVLLYGIMGNRARQLAMIQHAEVLSAKDGLISLASHQLRTPATAVKQYIELVLEGYVGRLPAAQRDMLKKAQSSNDRQLETIDQILYVSRLDSGRLRLQMEPTNVKTMVKEVIAEQRTSIRNRGQSISYISKHNVPMAPMDRRYARMCLENLISNASKYSHHEGKITVRVLETGSMIAVSVEDDGVGIAKSEESRLFQKFVRLDNELSIEAGGSGVGLYLVKEIMRLHGGKVEVDSVEGKGTTFTLLFPKNS